MKRVIATGIQDFEKLRVNRNFYVDKTDFISQWWNGGDDVTLITRPRRFGKTLNMSMLNCFFSQQYANRPELFEGLNVWEDPAMRKQQGKWPVIFLSFADIKQEKWEDARKVLNEKLMGVRNAFRPIMEDPMFTDEDRTYFYAIRKEMDDATAATSLYNLCGWLERYYGKKVIVLLDEYDTPMQEAYIHGFWDEMAAYTRALFNSTFKTNPSLERGIMTGITRVSKESIFSDLNNLVVITTTSSQYADCFGFTEEEVFQALEDQGFTEKDKQDVKRWYDGFTFGPVTDMYNPWSVTNFLKEKKTGVYWANTSSNGLVGKLLRTGDPELKKLFEALLQEEYIEVSLDEQIVFNHLDQKRNAIWSLLLASGYLKIIPVPIMKEPSFWEDPVYRLAITNLEVWIMFRNLIRDWFGPEDHLGTFVQAMLRGDVEEMNRRMNMIALQTFSSFDAGTHPGEQAPERFYHGFVLGILAEKIRDYHLRSNRESGYGRYDVMMEPKNLTEPAVIMEFKVQHEVAGEANLEDAAQNALNQIEKKKYDTELLARGIPPERILKYGFAFQGKECLIRKGA